LTLDLEGLLTRKRVLIGIAIAYWLVAIFFAYGMGVHEQGRIVAAMHGLERFYPGDARLGHAARAATEEGSEAELVTLLAFGAGFLMLLVAWRVWDVLRSDSDERTAVRRAARRAPFEAPVTPEPALPDPIVVESPVEPVG
jgi:hypothetical protein